MTSLTTTNRIVEHLEKYVYDKIWNEPYSEYRTYFRPQILNAFKVTKKDIDGLVVINGVATELKTTEVVDGVWFGSKFYVTGGVLAERESGGGGSTEVLSDITVTGTTATADNAEVGTDDDGRKFWFGENFVIAGKTLSSEYTETTDVTFYPCSGFLKGECRNTLLPPFTSDEDLQQWFPSTAPKYFVYAIPASFFRSVKIDSTSWITLEEYCNKRLTDLNVFTHNGVILNRGYIHLKQMETNDFMLLAVDAKMFGKMTGSYKFADKIFFGKYVDSDGEPDNTIKTWKLEANQAPGNLRYDKTNTNTIAIEGATYVLHNGKMTSEGFMRETTEEGVYVVQEGDYIEAVWDKDVIGKFEVDPSDPGLVYHDSTVSEDRVLIHIPYSINPLYHILTPSTCDIWLMPKDSKFGGIYLYPCERDMWFHQITHNDFSISRSYIDELAILNDLGNYVIRVYVREHKRYDEEGNMTRPKVFVRDANYIDFLYNLNDSEIIQMLMGTHPYQLANRKLLFWRADHLEDCKYADALVRKRDTRGNTPVYTWNEVEGKYIVKQDQCTRCGLSTRCELYPVQDHQCRYYWLRSVQDYIDILGYYHVLCLIGKRITYFKVVQNDVMSVVVAAPLALSSPELEAEDFYPVVYHNGYRIDPSLYSISATTLGSTGTEEIRHEQGEILGNDIERSTRCTKFKISFAPVYNQTTDHRFEKDKEYYRQDGYAETAINPVSGLPEVVNTTYKFNLMIAGTDYEVGQLISSVSHKVYLKSSRFKIDDRIMVELFDNRELGMLQHHVRVSTDTDKIQMQTTDQWRVYKLDGNIYRRQEASHIGSFDKSTKILTIKQSLLGENLVICEGPKAEFDRFEMSVKNDTHGPIGNKFEYLTKAVRFDASTKYYAITYPEVETYTTGVEYFYETDYNTYNQTRQYQLEPGIIDEATFNVAKASYGHLYTKSVAEVEIGSEAEYEAALKEYKELYHKDYCGAFPLDDALVFVNNKRLINDLDFLTVGYTTTDDRNKFGVTIQNLSYLRNANTVDVLRSNTTHFEKLRGFLIGDRVVRTGATFLWFEDLSTLTLDGKVCACFKHTLGNIEVTDGDHRNGSPFEINTMASSRVVDILDADEKRAEDEQKLTELAEFFAAPAITDYRETVIPHSHKVYSTYLEKIVSDFLDTSNPFTFFLVGETTTKQVGSVPAGTVITNDPYSVGYFDKQFSDYAYLKENDLCYKLSEHDLGYVDVYPSYHRIATAHRETYRRLLYMVNKLSPADNIKHKDAIHE